MTLGQPSAAAAARGDPDPLSSKLEPSLEHLKAKDAMHKRVSDNFVELFWKVGLTMQTDDFFDTYTNALARTVSMCFETGLPDSAYQFANHEFTGRLMDLITNWMTGIDPRRIRTDLRLSRPEVTLNPAIILIFPFH